MGFTHFNQPRVSVISFGTTFPISSCYGVLNGYHITIYSLQHMIFTSALAQLILFSVISFSPTTSK